MTEQKTRQTVRVHFESGDLIVHPANNDIFFIKAERAIEACQRVVGQDERVRSFTEELLKPLAHWCIANKERIHQCLLGVPESEVIPVYVVGMTEAYDFELSESMTDLAFAFSEAMWNVCFQQIPRCSKEDLCGYFDVNSSLELFSHEKS